MGEKKGSGMVGNGDYMLAALKRYFGFDSFRPGQEEAVGAVISGRDVMAVMPADKPRYILLTMLDEPKGLPETHGYATSGWNAAPTTGRIVERIGPMLGLETKFELPQQPFPLVARMGAMPVRQ